MVEGLGKNYLGPVGAQSTKFLNVEKTFFMHRVFCTLKLCDCGWTKKKKKVH